MKKIILLINLFFLALFCLSSYAKQNEQTLDKIVAVVNDDVITKTELTKAMATARIQIAQERLTVPDDTALQKQVLDQIINKKLQLQIAKQTNINVTDADVNKIISRIAQQNNVSTEELFQRINQDGMSTADYRNEMHDQITLQKLQQRELAGRINITPQEITSFMKSKVWQTNTAKEYHIEDILIPVSDTPSPSEIAAAKNHANEVYAKLKAGQDLKTISQADAENKQALQGGDLGWLKIPEIPSAFSDHIARMKDKDYAGPIQTSNGFHIIHLAESRALGKQEVPNRQQVQNLLLQRKFEEALQTWISKVRGQSFVQINS